jgi:hypothetical protein
VRLPLKALGSIELLAFTTPELLIVDDLGLRPLVHDEPLDQATGGRLPPIRPDALWLRVDRL